MHKPVYVEQGHEGFVFGFDCIRSRVNRPCNKCEVFFSFSILLQSDTTQHWPQAQAGRAGSVTPGMYHRILNPLEIDVPDLVKQEPVASQYRQLDSADESLGAR